MLDCNDTFSFGKTFPMVGSVQSDAINNIIYNLHTAASYNSVSADYSFDSHIKLHLGMQDTVYIVHNTM